MEFWLIEDGEKAGPYQDYAVRHRIEAGELGPETQGWHRDQDGWRPLREIETFRSEFEKPVVPAAPEPVPPPSPQNSATWGGAIIRFLARWVDILLYQVLIFGLLRLTGVNVVSAGESGWFLVVFVLPLLAGEGFFLNRWGTTPGKWLGGVRLATAEGERLSWISAFLRSFRVYVMGLGMLLHPFLSLACQGFGLWFLLKKKCALWDLRERTEVRIPEVRPERILLLFLAAVVLLVGSSAMVMAALMEASDQLPEPLRGEVEQFKELWEKAKSGPDEDA